MVGSIIRNVPFLWHKPLWVLDHSLSRSRRNNSKMARSLGLGRSASAKVRESRMSDWEGNLMSAAAEPECVRRRSPGSGGRVARGPGSHRAARSAALPASVPERARFCFHDTHIPILDGSSTGASTYLARCVPAREIKHYVSLARTRREDPRPEDLDPKAHGNLLLNNGVRLWGIPRAAF
jgi:hypothetical protein